MVIPLALTTVRVAKAAIEQQDKLRSAFDRLAQDDISALEDVYDLCGNDVYGLALWSTGSPSDASDIVQEVFLKLARIRCSLNTIRNPRNYILQITQRLGIDFYRDRKRRMTREEPIEFLEPAFVQDQSNLEDRMHLHDAISKLNPKQRQILFLRYFAGLSFSEIAEISDLNLFTAAGRCRVAVQQLRAILRKKS